MRIIKEHNHGMYLELEDGTFIRDLGDGRYCDDERDEDWGVIGSIALPYEGECDESGSYTGSGKSCYCRVSELMWEIVQAIAVQCPDDMGEDEFGDLVGAYARDLAKSLYYQVPVKEGYLAGRDARA